MKKHLPGVEDRAASEDRCVSDALLIANARDVSYSLVRWSRGLRETQVTQQSDGLCPRVLYPEPGFRSLFVQALGS